MSDHETNPKVLSLLKSHPGYATVKAWPEKGLYQFVARLCYKPHIFTPDPSEFGRVFSKATGQHEPGYTCAFSIPPQIDVSPLMAGFAAALREKGILQQGQKLPSGLCAVRLASDIENADGKKPFPTSLTGEWRQGKTKSLNKPVVWANVGGVKKPLSEGQVRGGYWVLLSVSLGAFDAKDKDGRSLNKGTQLYLNDICLLFPDDIVEGGGGVQDPSASYGSLDDLPPSDVSLLDAEEEGGENWTDNISF